MDVILQVSESIYDEKVNGNVQVIAPKTSELRHKTSELREKTWGITGEGGTCNTGLDPKKEPESDSSSLGSPGHHQEAKASTSVSSETASIEQRQKKPEAQCHREGVDQ
ncbi:hypothetical protein HPP92_003362 [Vanilla planifolia]|uniref:Uncharacterized protein n=1 Tax=Vanilla planifolia TaxID=51239 RepID=A0A835VJC0_VANPL|nr:hypothetical protein HPP92_003362 [Vanilla planifolia]